MLTENISLKCGMFTAKFLVEIFTTFFLKLVHALSGKQCLLPELNIYCVLNKHVGFY